MKKWFILAITTTNLTVANAPQLMQQAHHYIQHKKYHDALKIYHELEHTFPNHPILFNNIGYALKKLHEYQAAITIYERALQTYPNDPRLNRGASHAYLMLGDFKNGWRTYEYRWKEPPAYNNELKAYLEAGGSLAGKTVHLVGEFGLGDTLMFIRYAQELKKMGATIYLECQAPLVPLLSLCTYLDHVASSSAAIPATNFKALLMSMPWILENVEPKIPNNVPYLLASPSLVNTWKKRLSPSKKFNIGICWQGDLRLDSPDDEIKQDARAKSMPLAAFHTLAHSPHVQLYSLQKGVTQKSINTTTKGSIHGFDDLDTSSGAFMDSAALIAQLDLVITVDTSIAHLAGAMGIKTWVLLPYHADWRWMHNHTDSPWYPTMRLFRQKKDANWRQVIEEINSTLSKEIQPCL